MTAAGRARAWLEALPAAELAALADAVATEAFTRGLAVYRAHDDRFVPIPITLTPAVEREADLAALAADSRRLLSAAIRAAIWTLRGAGRSLGERLYAGFTPLERESVERDPDRLARVATARVDLFHGGGRPRALELNATIPAMQGYSDIALEAWLRGVARARGLGAAEVDRLAARAPSNTADLLASLEAWYRRLGGAGRPSIVIVSRRGDAQLGELRHYERAFLAAGVRAQHAWADEVDVGDDGRLRARGEPFDLLYRHIFARRVDPAWPLARLLRDPGPNVVLNPVVSPLEVKGLLSVLHEAATSGGSPDLAADEVEAVRRLVPWTRLLTRGSARLPDGAEVPDLAAWAAAHPERLVLKKSWDYGGRAVHLGPIAPGWPELVAQALADSDTWVLQEYVTPATGRHLLVERDDAGRPAPRWRDLFLDLSVYTAAGADAVPGGGVCRASSSQVVNILGGGGLAPLVPAALLEELFP